MITYLTLRAALTQMAATDVDAAHPGGIDFLVANAGIATVEQDINTPDIDLCAVRPSPPPMSKR